jgi:hypothetical protein
MTHFSQRTGEGGEGTQWRLGLVKEKQKEFIPFYRKVGRRQNVEPVRLR